MPAFRVVRINENQEGMFDFVIENESNVVYSLQNQLAKIHNCVPYCISLYRNKQRLDSNDPIDDLFSTIKIPENTIFPHEFYSTHEEDYRKYKEEPAFYYYFDKDLHYDESIPTKGITVSKDRFDSLLYSRHNYYTN